MTNTNDSIRCADVMDGNGLCALCKRNPVNQPTNSGGMVTLSPYRKWTLTDGKSAVECYSRVAIDGKKEGGAS